MAVGTWKTPNNNLSDADNPSATQYKINIDACAAIAKRYANNFAVHEQASPNMTIRVEAGYIFDFSGTLTEYAAQSSGTITAPTVNPRIDRIILNPSTGAVSIITGTESATPSAPTITADRIPLAQIALTVGQSTITNTSISDERVLPIFNNLRIPGNLTTANVRASGSGGLDLQNNSGTSVLTLGAGGGTGASFKGNVIVEGTSSAGSQIALREDTDNGNNSFILKCHDALAGDILIEAPSTYAPSNGQALVSTSAGVLGYAESVVQTVTSATTSVITCSTTIPVDNTIPQNTEGTEVITQAITPRYANSRLKIEVDVPYGAGGAGYNTGALFVDSTAGAIAAFPMNIDGAGSFQTAKYTYIVSSASTTARTYKLRVGPASGTSYVNSYNSTSFFGGTMAARITITEFI